MQLDHMLWNDFNNFYIWFSFIWAAWRSYDVGRRLNQPIRNKRAFKSANQGVWSTRHPDVLL